MTGLRLLYLGFAFPPGLQARYPHLNPAGHAFEVQLAAELRKHFDLRTVGTLQVPVPASLPPADPATGLPHHLLLQDRPPQLFHRLRSLLLLKRAYPAWLAESWQPDCVLTYNLTPVYNVFIRWLRHRRWRPKLVLLLMDSTQLGRPMPRLKRLRYRLKPLIVPDAEMVACFDAGIGASPALEPFFAGYGLPFLWMPGGCSPTRAPFASSPSAAEEASGSLIRFCYFGALADHAGIRQFVDIFLRLDFSAELHVCGYGKLSAALSELAGQSPRLKFHGLLPAPDDCLRLARSCDVLVNPRPASHGNENNFASKLFEYALCARSILTSRLSGAELVLGPEAFYFDPKQFDTTLLSVLRQIVATPRSELRRRGQALHDLVTEQYSWSRQGERINRFLHSQPSSCT